VRWFSTNTENSEASTVCSQQVGRGEKRGGDKHTVNETISATQTISQVIQHNDSNLTVAAGALEERISTMTRDFFGGIADGGKDK